MMEFYFGSKNPKQRVMHNYTHTIKKLKLYIDYCTACFLLYANEVSKEVKYDAYFVIDLLNIVFNMACLMCLVYVTFSTNIKGKLIMKRREILLTIRPYLCLRMPVLDTVYIVMSF